MEATKGNPEAAKPAEAPKPEIQKEEPYHFPPCTAAPQVKQNPLTGDVWLGFNPGGMSRRVALAWAHLQVEAFYAQLAAQMSAAKEAAEKNGKKPHWSQILNPFKHA